MSESTTPAAAPAPLALTPEETAAILADRERKEAAAQAAQEAAAADAKAAADAQARKDQPTEFAGIEDSTGSVAYIPFPARRERTILVGEVTYEHCRTDVDGVWVYRRA